MSGCTDLLTPLDLSAKLNLANLPNLNYTNQDYASLKTRIVQYIEERFPNDYSDFVEGSLFIVLAEVWAFIADTLSFKIDQVANEPFIDTVTEVENAFRLSKFVGFQPLQPIASRAFFSATIQTPLVSDLVLGNAIPLDLSSPDGLIAFELFPADSLNNPIIEGDITITAGNFTNTNIIGLEGITQTDQFTALGGANQSYLLTNSPVLYDSIRVDVDGQRWVQVPYFTDSNPRNEYRVEFDSRYRAFIMFGNGMAGRAPTAGSQIAVTFRVGGGTRGNIVAGAISSQRGYSAPGFNFPVPVSFRNYTRGEFGYAGDGLAEIRRKLPEYIKTQERAVSGEDYQILASQFASPHNGQSGKAVAALRNFGCAGNVIDIYVLVKEGTDGLVEANDEFKVELSNYLEDKKMMTDRICIRDGVILEVDVTVDLVLDRFWRKFRDEIDRKVRNKIAEFFSLNNWDFGKSLRDSELMKYLTQFPEISNVSMTFTTTDPDNTGTLVTARYYEIIRNDQIVLNFIFDQD